MGKCIIWRFMEMRYGDVKVKIFRILMILSCVLIRFLFHKRADAIPLKKKIEE